MVDGDIQEPARLVVRTKMVEGEKADKRPLLLQRDFSGVVTYENSDSARC